MLAIVRDPLYKKHSNGPGHPESPERLKAIDEMLKTFPLKEQIRDIKARDAYLNELERVHETAYIKRIEMTKNSSYTMLDPDTCASADSYAAALRAAGGTMEAVRAVLSEKYCASLAFVRPPGHHAEKSRAMGFCLFNNAAVGALHAVKDFGLKRVLIVDWDVHHGNGTMHSFYKSNQVMYFSIHQYPHYPGTGRIDETGAGKGEGYTVNVPLSGGRGDGEYIQVFHRVFKPIAMEFQPELILISAGFDAHKDDPLAGMELTSGCYGSMTSILKSIADTHCPGRIVIVLEGGYSLTALSEGISNVMHALFNKSEAISTPSGSHASDGYISTFISEVISAQKPYWKSLK